MNRQRVRYWDTDANCLAVTKMEKTCIRLIEYRLFARQLDVLRLHLQEMSINNHMFSL